MPLRMAAIGHVGVLPADTVTAGWNVPLPFPFKNARVPGELEGLLLAAPITTRSCLPSPSKSAATMPLAYGTPEETVVGGSTPLDLAWRIVMLLTPPL